MHMLSDLIRLAARLRRDKTPVGVATLVKKEGSTYRQPGARMVVEADGTAHGMVSGGCLESEVTQQALEVLRTGTAVLRRYDLTYENTVLGYDAGCAGAAHLLIEPTEGGLDLLLPFLEQRTTAVLAHIIGCPSNTRLLGARKVVLPCDAAVASPDWPASLDPAHRGAALQAGNCTEVITVASQHGPLELFLEVVHPPIRLVAFGSGPDVGPLVRMAKHVGWTAEVVGAKPAAALEWRIPDADKHTFLMHPQAVLDYVAVDSRTVAVLMNHNKVRDTALLEALRRTDIPYIGLLGPPARCEAISGQRGRTEHAIHGPVGLDIGAETPEEIALSIVAEIQCVMAGFAGGSLRDKRGMVHRRIPHVRDAHA